MRVITGIARGQKLAAPQGMQTRPTSDMTKEAMFSIVQFEIEAAEVLDLFAGSGQLGIEALSRGAKRAVFVDSSRQAQEVIMQNLQKTKLTSGARVVQTEAESFLASTKDMFDIALLDPPYNQGILDRVLPMTAEHMRRGGIILCETERGEVLPQTAGAFVLQKEYFYGKAKLTAYRIPEEENR